MQPSDEIKSRLDIVDIIKEYIQLKAVGSNFSALSPFNNEKTPSFMVSPEKQIWHCFSSGKGGDLISFVMEIEGINFVEALRILAPKAGVTLQRQDPKLASERNRLLDIMEVASNYYHQVLFSSNQSEYARNYLKERQLTEETLIDWKVGFSIDSWNDLVDFLRKRGYKDAEIVKAGLANQKKGSYNLYNRFRDRVMFPISNVNGDIVAFTARVRPDKEEGEIMGKYINSPQTLIYNKSKIIFGLDKAKIEIRSSDLAVVVEGQMDVVTAHQNGFKNVVGSSGTAFTEDQLRLIKRYTNNIAFAFDMDNAGQIATDRAIKGAMAMDMNIKVLILPEGKDPDDFLKKDPQEWQNLVDNAKSSMSYYFDKIFSAVDMESVDGKREVVKKILPIINNLKNLVEKDFWLKKLSQDVGVDEKYLREALNGIENQRGRYNKEEVVREEKEVRKISDEEKKEEYLLTVLIKFPIFLEHVVTNIDKALIFGENNKLLYNSLIIYYNDEKSTFNFEDFKKYLELSDLENKNEQIKLLDKLVISAEGNFEELNEKEAKKEILNIIILLKKGYLKKVIKTIERQMSIAEKDNNKEEIEKLTLKLIEVSKKIRNLTKI